MKVAATSGGLGDIVYSIPVMKELGVTKVCVKQSYYAPPYGSLYTAIRSLLQVEGFEVKPTDGGFPAMKYEPGLRFDYDMDRFRLMPKRGKVFIPTNMRRYFRLPSQDYKPWLTIPAVDGDYTVVHVTNRWNGGQINWREILAKVDGKKLFCGFQHEWVEFCAKFGDIQWYPTDDVLDLAMVIAGAKSIYCNQTVTLALAQGLGKNYWLERNPGKTNCLIYHPNEHVLNP